MEKREYMMKNVDWLRTLMITEPRGYPCQNLDVILPSTPACPEAAFSYIVAENNFVYPAMSGHNTICVVTALLESGMVPMVEPVTEFVLEAPAGPIHITAECEAGKCKNVTFRNAPAFAREEDLNLMIEVPTLGPVPVDVAYGGMWYAIINAEDVGLSIKPEHAGELARIGEMVKVATREQHPVQHPTIDYPGCDIMAIRGEASAEAKDKYGAHASNAVIMSTGPLDWNQPSTWTGNLDRSPCGSGTSAIMAAMHAKGELAVGEPFIHEGILGTVFTGTILEETEVGGLKAMIPAVKGEAWVTQYSKVVVDPTDPFPTGYTLGDIWAC
jgi:proline racemase